MDPEEKRKILKQMGEDAKGMDVDSSQKEKKNFFTRNKIVILVFVVGMFIGGAITAGIFDAIRSVTPTEISTDRALNSTGGLIEIETTRQEETSTDRALKSRSTGGLIQKETTKKEEISVSTENSTDRSLTS